jgi:hypothetical protein
LEENEEEEGRGKGSQWMWWRLYLTKVLDHFFSYMFTFQILVLIRRDEKNTHSTASGVYGSVWYFIAASSHTFWLKNTTTLQEL